VAIAATVITVAARKVNNRFISANLLLIFLDFVFYGVNGDYGVDGVIGERYGE
jgi:hypothetical protein